MAMFRVSKSGGLTRQGSRFLFNRNSLVELFTGRFPVFGNGFESAISQAQKFATAAGSNASSAAGNEKVPFKSSLKATEAAKFAAMADTWWDHEGPFKPLHLMNPTRISFIRSALCQHFRKDPNSSRPFEGLRIIDVGCGGGLLCEPLSRMGAQVTGIDAVEKNINVALLHAVRDPLTASIDYRCTTAEQLVQQKEHFDAVISLEVIEHVADPQEFVKSLAELTVDNGAVLISTINRTMRSYFMAIVAAEYILGWLPRGTHDWSNLITPVELVLLIKRASISVHEVAGLVYDPLRNDWRLSDDTDVNYIAFGVKHSL